MGQNALHFAAKAVENSFDRKKFIEILIESGADVTCKDKVTREHFYKNKLLSNSGR